MSNKIKYNAGAGVLTPINDIGSGYDPFFIPTIFKISKDKIDEIEISQLPLVFIVGQEVIMCHSSSDLAKVKEREEDDILLAKPIKINPKYENVIINFWPGVIRVSKDDLGLDFKFSHGVSGLGESYFYTNKKFIQKSESSVNFVSKGYESLNLNDPEIQKQISIGFEKGLSVPDSRANVYALQYLCDYKLYGFILGQVVSSLSKNNKYEFTLDFYLNSYNNLFKSPNHLYFNILNLMKDINELNLQQSTLKSFYTTVGKGTKIEDMRDFIEYAVETFEKFKSLSDKETKISFSKELLTNKDINSITTKNEIQIINPQIRILDGEFRLQAANFIKLTHIYVGGVLKKTLKSNSEKYEQTAANKDYLLADPAYIRSLNHDKPSNHGTSAMYTSLVQKGTKLYDLKDVLVINLEQFLNMAL